MLLSATIRRHVCFTLVALSLSCQAFVTSSRFGMPPFVRGGAASSSPLDKETTQLGVLRAPPRSSRCAAADDDDDDDDGHYDDEARHISSVSTTLNGGSQSVRSRPDVYDNNNNNSDEPAETTRAFRSQSVEYVAETKLPTDVGAFQLRGYKIPGAPVGQEPCVIYCRDKPPFGQDGAPASGVPVRIHDQCLTSEVFRSQR